MATVNSTSCCGIDELGGVQDTTIEGCVYEAAEDWHDNGQGAFIFFSVIDNYLKKGTALTAYIRKNKLGTVTKMPATHNSNSGNTLHMYVWRVNKKSIEAYYKNQN